ncbi:MAG: Type II/IV secretion system ATPase [Candidatus Magasanikbacteria bacterium GW2011_GWA2_56_11]|uniref:Type II/IV secretion system ATPase n=1 Tax=Candidatus Magasanikbacteria bacterium GW2011_GWA2_56_11 TaxID=1619044 RepID=A0A0G1YHW2_9BACT|nr:MAG: Type II/IV secretion system ATPase [Candidatus Magasanikbacteria bacterium GW2011_GWA2_56_11]
MPRIKFVKIQPWDFFLKVKKASGLSFKEMAQLCATHRRTLSDWKRGRYLMPLSAYEALFKLGGNEEVISIIPDYSHASAAGKKGAARRYQIHGNPGTDEGRKRGGLAAVRKLTAIYPHAIITKFQRRRPIALPELSCNLAEMIGIILGDGHVSAYQTTVTLHSLDDRLYSGYVAKQFESLFQIKPAIYERQSTLVITVARVALSEYLHCQHGLSSNKVKTQVSVPSWIVRHDKFAQACVRGLIDTDGCFYVDRHQYLNKRYLNCALNFTNRSLPILKFVKDTLSSLDLHPTQKTPYSIFLRREREIERYFKEIGSNNPKHTDKFKKFIANKTHGGVPKRS